MTDIYDWDLSKWSYPTLNRLCTDLRGIGVDATVATKEGLKELANRRQEGSPQLKKTGLFPTKEVGFVEIKQSPIRWIHLTHVVVGWWEGEDMGEHISMDYWVPDSRRLPFPVGARMQYVTRSIFSGRIVDTKWSVDGLSKRQRLELEHYLNNDEVIKTTILSFKKYLNRFADVGFGSWPWYGCWGIATSFDPQLDFPTPSMEEWLCYEKIAALLLKAPIPA